MTLGWCLCKKVTYKNSSHCANLCERPLERIELKSQFDWPSPCCSSHFLSFVSAWPACFHLTPPATGKASLTHCNLVTMGPTQESGDVTIYVVTLVFKVTTMRFELCCFQEQWQESVCVCVLARAREVNELSRTYEEEILF